MLVCGSPVLGPVECKSFVFLLPGPLDLLFDFVGRRKSRLREPASKGLSPKERQPVQPREPRNSAVTSPLARPMLSVRRRPSRGNYFSPDASMNTSREIASAAAQTSFALSDDDISFSTDHTNNFKRLAPNSDHTDSAFNSHHSEREWNSAESSDSDFNNADNVTNHRHGKFHSNHVNSSSVNLASKAATPPIQHKHAHLHHTTKSSADFSPVESRHPYISMLLLVIMGLFFAWLAFMYFNMTASSGDAKGQSINSQNDSCNNALSFLLLFLAPIIFNFWILDAVLMLCPEKEMVSLNKP